MFRSKTLRLVVLAAFMGGLGWLVWRAYFYQTTDSILHNSEKYFADGEAALKNKDGQGAYLRFHESELQADKLLERVEAQLKKEREMPEAEAEQLKLIRSKGYWLKAKSMRDLAYARGLKDGRPVPEVEDSTTGEKFRSFMAIPDVTEREKAVTALGVAAIGTPKVGEMRSEQVKGFSLEVLNEALRTFVQMNPLPWEYIPNFANSLLVLNPNDTRALFMLARFEFEQPQTNKSGPLPLKKRSRSRMQSALDYVTRLKAGGPGSYPMWRTWYIEGQIRYWLKEDSLRRKDDLRFERETDELRVMLFDPEKGALKRISQGEGLNRLSTWDAEGVLAMFPLALEESLDENRKTGREGPKIMNILKDCLDFCQRMEQKKDPAFQADMLVGVPVTVLSKAQPVLSQIYPEEWAQIVIQMKPTLQNALQRSIGAPRSFALFADTLYRDSLMLPKETPREKRQELAKEAMTYLDHGLALGKARKLQGAEMIDYHALAADMRFSFAKKREDLDRHLEVLKDVNSDEDPEARALYNLLEGALYERESRLEKARQHLEKVEQLFPNSDLQFRAAIVLSNVYLSMGEADRASVYLKQVSKGFGKFESLAAPEKLWALDFFGSKDEVDAVLVTALLEAGKQRIFKFVKENPQLKTSPYGQAENYEKESQRLIDRIPAQTRAQRTARHALAKYYAVTGRMTRGRDELVSLQVERPEDVQLLQTEITFNLIDGQVAIQAGKLTEGELFQSVDSRIQTFLKEFPTDYAARLYWAAWLTGSKRPGEAIRYLEDPANFPIGKDESYYRTLAMAFIAKGDREDANRALQHLPRTPAVDSLMLQMLADLKERDVLLQESLNRHENKGLLRCWEGAVAYQAGNYKESVDKYLLALDFTLVKPLAQVGMQKALQVWAQKDPIAARTQILDWLREFKDEASLYLSFAFASVLVDEVGEPSDFWERHKSMASSLYQWEANYQRDNPDRTTAPLTKAEYWQLAGRPDIARGEVIRALRIDPKNTGAISAYIQLVVNSQDVDSLSEARNHMATLKKLQPAASATALLECRLEEREGDPGRVIPKYEAFLKKHPHVGDGYFRLTQLLDKKEDTSKLAFWIAEWRKQQPNDLIGLSTEVYFLASEKKTAQANQLAEEFLKVHEEQIKKKVEQIKDRNPEKQAVIRKTMEEGVRDIIYLEVAKGFGRAKAWTEAEAWANKLIQLAPKNVAPKLVLGDLYMAQQNWPQARALYESVWDEKRPNQAVGNNLSWLLLTHFNEVEEAYKVAQKSRTGRFSNAKVSGERLRADFLDTLGNIYIRLGKAEALPEMRDLFEGAKKRYLLDARMYYYLGFAYAGLRETDLAKRMFESATNLARANLNNPLSQSQRQQLLRRVAEDQQKLQDSLQ